MSFGLTLKTLPDSYKKLLSADDRKALGEDGLLTEEILARGKVEAEKDLQKLIESLLRLKGIEPIRARMDAPTTTKKGTPDFLFAVWTIVVRSMACAWEVKLPGEKLSDDQEKMREAMIAPPNGWNYRTITSVDQARAELRAMGVE